MKKQIPIIIIFIYFSQLSFHSIASNLQNENLNEINNIKDRLTMNIPIKEKINLTKNLINLTNDSRYYSLLDALNKKNYDNDKKVQTQLFWATPSEFLNKKYTFAKELNDNYQPLEKNLDLEVKKTIESYNNSEADDE